GPERRGRHARMARPAARGGAQNLDPHQQHESDPERILRRGARAGAPRCRGGAGRHGNRPMSASSEAPWSRAEFESQLRRQGASYHIHHPFNVVLNTGKASREQIQGWVANRYYYQMSIPIKDAAILANCPDRAVRRNWVQRILDHDGYGGGPGGVAFWFRRGGGGGVCGAGGRGGYDP